MLLCLLLTSCGASRRATGTPSGSTEKPKTEDKQARREERKEEKQERREERKEERREEKHRSALDDSLDRVFPTERKERYKVALLLPFGLDKGELSKSQKQLQGAALDFYKGAMLGADSLRHCGAKLDIYPIESQRNSFEQRALNDTLAKLGIDLVLGPLMEKNVMSLQRFCRDNRINLVSPVDVADTCYQHPFYIQSNPEIKSYGLAAAEAVRNRYKDYRIILVNDRTTKADPIAQAFVDNVPKDSLHIVDFKGKGALTQPALKEFSPRRNVVFLPSRNEVFNTAALSQLQLDSSEETILIVTYPWMNYKSIDGELWERFHFHVLTPYHVDYNRPEVQTFLENYRSRYNDEPNEWAFRGFDEIVYYGSLLHKHGKYFQRHFGSETLRMLHNGYRLERKPDCPCYGNASLPVLKFENYELRSLGE